MMGDKGDQHQVTLTKDYYIQTTPVTQGQWKAVMGNNPSEFKNCGDSCPVENVSWNDVQEFIKKLNKNEATTKYRLTTEAEWEYACRAGSEAEFCFGDDEELLADYGWHEENSDYETHPVGQKKPNDWGLYDMHGNVWEWCQDWYGHYPSEPVTDPRGPSSGSFRVFRGGGWYNVAHRCRSANRNRSFPASRHGPLGFRLARTP